MGNFLDTPITDKSTAVSEDPRKHIFAAVSSMQGWRSSMEDDHLVLVSVPQAKDVALFGVFDGHGGAHVAHFTASNMERHFTRSAAFQPPYTAQALSATFKSSVLALDAELQTLPQHMDGQDQSGSTLTMVAITADTIVCANTGDSRSVLCRAGTAVDLSTDHKPVLEQEKERIERAGSHVQFNRVNGDLAVSRALGDFSYKTRGDLPPEVQAVTADPEIKVQPRTPDDEFIVLACDGIWDVMTSQDVVTYVSQLLRSAQRPARDEAPEQPQPQQPPNNGEPKEQPPPPRPWDMGAVAEMLLDVCLEKGSKDNMSVVIVALKPEFAPGTSARRHVGGAVAPPSTTESSIAAPGVTGREVVAGTPAQAVGVDASPSPKPTAAAPPLLVESQGSGGGSSPGNPLPKLQSPK